MIYYRHIRKDKSTKMPRDGPFWSILEYKQTDIYDSYTLVSNIQYLVWAWWSGVTKVCWANGVTRVCPGLIPALLPADHLLWAATNIAFNLNNLILINLTLTNLIIINPTQPHPHQRLWDRGEVASTTVWHWRMADSGQLVLPPHGTPRLCIHFPFQFKFQDF